MSSSHAQRARKLLEEGRGHELAGNGVTVRDPDPLKVRPDGIPADAVAGLKVRFGFRWLRAAEVSALMLELGRRLPYRARRRLVSDLSLLDSPSGGPSDAGGPGEEGETAA